MLVVFREATQDTRPDRKTKGVAEIVKGAETVFFWTDRMLWFMPHAAPCAGRGCNRIRGRCTPTGNLSLSQQPNKTTIFWGSSKRFAAENKRKT